MPDAFSLSLSCCVHEFRLFSFKIQLQNQAVEHFGSTFLNCYVYLCVNFICQTENCEWDGTTHTQTHKSPGININICVVWTTARGGSETEYKTAWPKHVKIAQNKAHLPIKIRIFESNEMKHRTNTHWWNRALYCADSLFTTIFKMHSHAVHTTEPNRLAMAVSLPRYVWWWYDAFCSKSFSHCVRFWCVCVCEWLFS